MLFNLLRGHNPGLGVISGAVTGIDAARISSIPLTVKPIAAIFRTTVGSNSEMAVYYRSELGADLTLISGGSASVSTRLYSEIETSMAVLTTGTSKGNVASMEYYILGVNKE